MKPAYSHVLTGLAGAGVVVAAGALMGMQGTMVQKLTCLTAEEKEILSHLSIVYLELPKDYSTRHRRLRCGRRAVPYFLPMVSSVCWKLWLATAM